MSTLPNPAPIITSTTKAFWDATTEGRFTLQKCEDRKSTRLNSSH